MMIWLTCNYIPTDIYQELLRTTKYSSEFVRPSKQHTFNYVRVQCEQREQMWKWIKRSATAVHRTRSQDAGIFMD